MDLYELLAAFFDVAMRVANLLLEYLKVLVWPAAVLTLALIYRRPLISLLHRIREASGWGVSVKAEASDLAVDAQVTRAVEEATVRSSQAVESTSPATPPAAEDTEPRPSTPRPNTPAEQTTSGPRPAHEPVEPETVPSATELGRTHQVDQTTLDRIQRAMNDHNHEVTRFKLSRRRPENRTIFSWIPEAEFIEGHSANQRTARVENAWLTLVGLAFTIGKTLNLPGPERTPTNVVLNLAELGYVTVGPWRIAARLERLYDVIKSDPNPPSAEVADDFVEAAHDLTSILVTVNERLKSSQALNANGEPQPTETNDPDTNTPT